MRNLSLRNMFVGEKFVSFLSRSRFREIRSICLVINLFVMIVMKDDLQDEMKK